jgi:hypothetical protein
VANATTSKQSATENIWKQWTTNWCIQKDEKSAVSKLSSSGKSIKTICSQLSRKQKTSQPHKKLKNNSKKESELHLQQMIKHNQKWKEHLDSETTAFTTCMEQEKQMTEAATNQTIKTYEAMNNRLQLEKDTIKLAATPKLFNKQSCSNRSWNYYPDKT